MPSEAWVTLATNDTYALGALVLAHSLRRVGTTRQIVIMITPTVTESMRELLDSTFDSVRMVNVLDSQDPAHLALIGRPDLGVTFTKLHCWTFTDFTKCVFMDADTLVVQNCDDLFGHEELTAVPDPGWPSCFNSGVFVFVPSTHTFEALLKTALECGSFDGGDQGLLNIYFKDWYSKSAAFRLPFTYNMTATTYYAYAAAYKHFGKDAKIVHFLGAVKPWHQDASTSAHHAMWWNVLNKDVKPQIQERHVQAASEPANAHGYVAFGYGRMGRWESLGSPSGKPTAAVRFSSDLVDGYDVETTVVRKRRELDSQTASYQSVRGAGEFVKLKVEPKAEGLDTGQSQEDLAPVVVENQIDISKEEKGKLTVAAPEKDAPDIQSLDELKRADRAQEREKVRLQPGPVQLETVAQMDKESFTVASAMDPTKAWKESPTVESEKGSEPQVTEPSAVSPPRPSAPPKSPKRVDKDHHPPGELTLTDEASHFAATQHQDHSESKSKGSSASSGSSKSTTPDQVLSGAQAAPKHVIKKVYPGSKGSKVKSPKSSKGIPGTVPKSAKGPKSSQTAVSHRPSRQEPEEVSEFEKTFNLVRSRSSSLTTVPMPKEKETAEAGRKSEQESEAREADIRKSTSMPHHALDEPRSEIDDHSEPIDNVRSYWFKMASSAAYQEKQPPSHIPKTVSQSETQIGNKVVVHIPGKGKEPKDGKAAPRIESVKAKAGKGSKGAPGKDQRRGAGKNLESRPLWASSLAGVPSQEKGRETPDSISPASSQPDQEDVGRVLEGVSLKTEPSKRQDWEEGNIDYTGRDSFARIQEQLDKGLDGKKK